MAETLLIRAGVECDVVGMAGPDDLAGHSCLVLVAGGSSKGLGGAGLDQAAETARVTAVIKKAQELGIPVISEDDFRTRFGDSGV